jgi:hypothetical protein
MVKDSGVDDFQRRLTIVDPNAICLKNHTGAFCYGCEPGYTKRTDDKVCSLCTPAQYAADTGKVAGTFIAIAIGILLLITGYFLLTYRRYRIHKGHSKRHAMEERMTEALRALDIGALLQIVVGFVQVVSGMSMTFREILPPFFRSLRQVFLILAADVVNIFDFGCSFSNQNHFGTLLLATLTPMAFIWAVLCIRGILERTSLGQDRGFCYELRVASSTTILIVFFLIYPSCSNKILATFSCRTFDDGTSVINSDPSLSCQTEQYTGYAIYAGLMTIIYPVGVPVLYSTLLYRERRKINPYNSERRLDAVAEAIRKEDRSIQYLNFLWRPYHASRLWFGKS